MCILVVDDDEPIRQGLHAVLSEEGFQVCTADNGRSALQALRGTPTPQLVILDLMMPDMDGWQFRVAQKADPALRGIPVIAMSAARTPQAAAIDAAAYLPKPFSLDDLMTTVRQVIAAGQAQPKAQATRLAALGEVSAGLAHEINNPLTYVMANLDVLARKLPEGSLAMGELLALVKEASEGVQRVAKAMRDFQNSSPSWREDARPIDLRAPLKQALQTVRTDATALPPLVMDFGPTPLVTASAGVLERVFAKLLGYAIRSRRQNGDSALVVATGRAENGDAQAEIRWDWAAAAPTESTVAFSPTQRTGEHTAFDLPICHAVLTALGGELAMEARKGAGASFFVRLPAAPSAAVPNPAPQ